MYLYGGILAALFTIDCSGSSKLNPGAIEIRIDRARATIRLHALRPNFFSNSRKFISIKVGRP